jgi:hypothetical protein
MALDQPFEYATDADPALNYCLWPYAPVAPVADKFRSINLLYQSFDCAGIDARAGAIVEAIRDAIGPFRTVFGVKLLDGRLGWEFYFYDYARRDRQVSMSRVLRAIRPWAPTAVVPNENLPYFMFSLDLDDALARGVRELDVVHMYIGNPGSAVSSGIAYTVTRDSCQLDNFYFFFDAATQLPDVARKVASSAFFDETALPLDQVLIPALRRCKTICVANKQTHDCIYFSGVDVTQLLWFLEHLGYPQPIVAFVHANRHNLDHLLFDVGLDYRMEGGALRVLKSGYYGVF